MRRGRPGNRGPRLARYRARGHAGRCSTSATPVAGEWGLPTIVVSPAQAEGAPTGPARSHSRRRRRPRPATAIATGGTIRYPGDAGAMWSGATTATTSTTRAVPRAAVDGADLVADGVNGATVRSTDQGATPTVSTTLQLIAASSVDAAITLAVANFAAICGRASGLPGLPGLRGVDHERGEDGHQRWRHFACVSSETAVCRRSPFATCPTTPGWSSPVAPRAGRSLQEYLRWELIELASRPDSSVATVA